MCHISPKYGVWGAPYTSILWAEFRLRFDRANVKELALVTLILLSFIGENKSNSKLASSVRHRRSDHLQEKLQEQLGASLLSHNR